MIQWENTTRRTPVVFLSSSFSASGYWGQTCEEVQGNHWEGFTGDHGNRGWVVDKGWHGGTQIFGVTQKNLLWNHLVFLLVVICILLDTCMKGSCCIMFFNKMLWCQIRNTLRSKIKGVIRYCSARENLTRPVTVTHTFPPLSDQAWTTFTDGF